MFDMKRRSKRIKKDQKGSKRMKTCGCGDDIPLGRWALGYTECLSCGERTIRDNPPTRCAVPLNKSNYILVTRLAELKQLNPKYTHR